MLLRSAIAAGCAFEPRVLVTGAIVDRNRVTGVRVRTPQGRRPLDARVTIAADGRRSAIAWNLGAARHPVAPRRWAVGAYFTDVCGWPAETIGQSTDRQPGTSSTLGEMHIRNHGYVGVAPVADGLTNVCVVRPSAAGDAAMRHPIRLLRQITQSDPLLAPRFADAVLVTRPRVIGPLAVETTPVTLDGLLLAGDAAGFIDPMTGDGLRFAVRGGELAAHAALAALANGWPGVHARLNQRRRAEFGGKQRFNRVLRHVVSTPALVGAATVGARLAPAVLARIIAHAGDCPLAGRT
jgi:flavin-dependent dehydrogenase